MNNSLIVLLVIIIGLIATATGVDLANNTTILLILLLALLGTTNGISSCGCQYPTTSVVASNLI